MRTCKAYVNHKILERRKKRVLYFDRVKFKAQLCLSGVTNKELIDYLGLNTTTYYRKLKNDGSFTRDELAKIIDKLEIEKPEEIFFAKELT